MMKIMKRFILLLILLPAALLAQQYTLDDLVGYGLENSFDMQRAGLSYESSTSSLSSAKWNLLPEVNLNLGIKNDFYHPLTPAASDLSSNAGFSISKNISLNDAAWFNYKYAQLDEQKSRLQLSSGISSYAYSVFTAYLDVLSSQKQLASLNKNLEIQTRVWEQAKLLNELGKNTAFDLKESEIAVMNSRISIMQLENTIDTKRRELFGLTGMEDAGYELADLAPDPGFAIPDFTPEASSGVKLLKADLQKSELASKQNKLDYFPQVNLAYYFSRNVSGENFEFDDYSTSHTIGLNLSYSLWNQFKQNQTVKRSGISQRLAEIALQDQMDGNRRQYDILSRELEYLQRLDELYSEKLDQATQQIRIAEERFRLGLIELLELDKTRVEYINSDIAYNTNRYQILAKQEAIRNLLAQKIQGKW
jgi:outer membrane protein TolC